MLLVSGGIDVRLFGGAVTTHEPLRPLLIAAVMLVIVMFTGGDDAVVRPAVRAAHSLSRLIVAADSWPARLTPASAQRWCRIIVAGAAVTVTIVAIVFGAKVAGGSDSYGYLSQAEMWRSGHVSVPQPWARDAPWPDALTTFSPLGYVPARAPTFSAFGYSPASDPWAIVPMYSPGLPMLMAAARFIGGNPALYFVVPLCGGLLVLSTYGVGRRLGSPALGTIAAVLMAASPTFLEYVVQPMTDVPVAAGWMLVWWSVLGRTTASAWVAAITLAVTILTRPDRVPLAIPVLLWLVLSVARNAAEPWHHVRRAVVVLAGLGAGAFAIALLHWRWYGSPLASGYGSAGNLFTLTEFLPNLAEYSHLVIGAQTPLIVLGIIALLLPLRWLWPMVSDRRMLVVLAAFVVLVWIETCLIRNSTLWVRFLLPSYAPILIGLSAVLLLLVRPAWRGSRLVLAMLVIVFACNRVQPLVGWAFSPATIEAQYIVVAERVRQLTPENSVVLAVQHSGSARYYAGRITLRWDPIQPEWLDRAVAWMGERGVHSYLLIDDYEVAPMRVQFAGQKTLDAIGTPMFRLGGTAFYDLRPSPAKVETEQLAYPPRRMFGVPPAPPPRLTWGR